MWLTYLKTSTRPENICGFVKINKYKQKKYETPLDLHFPNGYKQLVLLLLLDKVGFFYISIGLLSLGKKLWEPLTPQE